VPRRHAVAFVEPGRKHRPVRIKTQRLETLALAVGRDWPQLGKALTAVGRSGVAHLTVEGLVPEDRKRQRDAAVFFDDKLGTGIGTPIEIQFLLRHLDRR
jgi:hypothetical protein